MPANRCLLAVHAHPDDESSKGAGTVARYHADGVRTVLVCCTGGEEGDVLNPAMDTPEVRADLARVRLSELETAAGIIGYDRIAMLGYRDSGMPDSEANARPEAFWNAPLEEATGRLVAIIREEQPQVIITYPEEQHEYPHPDHLKVHEITMLAWDAAGDPKRFPEAGPAYEPAKLYYTMWPRQRMRAMHEKFLELGIESPFNEGWTERLKRDDPITTSIELTGFEDIRGQALRAHATQVDPTSPFWFGLPPEVQRSLHPYDEFFLARTHGTPLRTSTEPHETDLYEGID